MNFNPGWKKGLKKEDSEGIMRQSIAVSGKNNPSALTIEKFNFYYDDFILAKKKLLTTFENYKDNTTDLDIQCLECDGVFKRSLNHFRLSKRCPLCNPYNPGGNNKLTKEEFIKRAKQIHGERYEYPLKDYKNTSTNTTIYCKKHKLSFEQTPKNHLMGKGCRVCGYEKLSSLLKMTKDEFVTKAKLVHGDLYNYDVTEYDNIRSFIDIFCNKCEKPFRQIASYHLNGNGCQTCAGTIKLTINDFIYRAELVHGKKYGYTKSNYINFHTPLEIECFKEGHGSFWQTPGSHIHQKSDCPLCAKGNISKQEKEWLDSLKIPERQYKIIIPNYGTVYADGYDPLTNTVYEYNGSYYHGDPSKYLAEDINPTNKRTYGELYLETLEREQILKDNGYNVISIWESDYLKQNKQT